MPPVKETRAHLMVVERVRMRNSVMGPGNLSMNGSPTKDFKMKRFADVKSKITTNRQI